jgi:hypothetical protein
MPLPKEFESVIQEEYGKFGWELSNCFNFIAEFLGHKVLDISSFETALKIIANDVGDSLTKYSHPNDLPNYIKNEYLKVHKVLIRKSKNINAGDEDTEVERQEAVVQTFVKYMFSNDFALFMIGEFYRDFLVNNVSSVIHDCLLDIEEKVNEENNETTKNDNK